MEHSYNIRSKLYIKPTKGKFAFRTALTIALILVLLSGIVRLMMDGFSIGTLGYMAIAFVIVTNYNKRTSSNPHYESTFAVVTVTNDLLSVEYKQLGDRFDNLLWVAKYEETQKLEYSDQLECLHIVGTIRVVDKMTEKVKEEMKEHLLYIEKGKEEAILNDLNAESRINIEYVDR